jgi:HAMP domain-containing protein
MEDEGVADFVEGIWPTEPGLGFLSLDLGPVVVMILALIWAVCLLISVAWVAPKMAKLASAKDKYQGDKMHDITQDLVYSGICIAGLVMMPTIITAFMKFSSGGAAWIDPFMAQFWPGFPSLGPLAATFGTFATSILAVVWFGAIIFTIANLPPKLVAIGKSRKQMAGGDVSQILEDLIINAVAIALVVLVPTIVFSYISFLG